MDDKKGKILMKKKIIAGVRRIASRNYLTYRLYRRSVELFKPIEVPLLYPTDINLEVTTVCNAHCQFCTRDLLIKSGKRRSQHMSLDLAMQSLTALHRITRDVGVPDDQIRFSPVGLGEPLLYPHLYPVITRARELFPRAHLHANSNCIALTEIQAEQLIDCGLDAIRLSLDFNNPDQYTEMVGVDKFYSVSENIARFLKRKGNRLPAVTIHILDQGLSGQGYKDFIRQWNPILNENDQIFIEPYIPMVQGIPANIPKYPCNQLWTTMMVDVSGNIFPCCLAVWYPLDEELLLGDIHTGTDQILSRVSEIRSRHIQGDYRKCSGCAYLLTYRDLCRRFYNHLTHRK